MIWQTEALAGIAYQVIVQCLGIKGVLLWKWNP